MRQIAFTVSVLLLLLNSAKAQPQGNRAGFRYRFTSTTIPSKYKLSDKVDPKSTSETTYAIPAGEVINGSIYRDNSTGRLLIAFWSSNRGINNGKPISADKFIDENSPGNMVIDLINTNRQIKDPVWVFKPKFRGYGIGISTIPFRYRFRSKINDSVKSNETVTSPRPDIALTFGVLWGHSTFSKHGVTHWPKSLSIFLGGTSAEIKNGVVKSKSELYGTGKATQINPALTYGLQFMIGRNNLGFVIAAGMESSIGVYSKDWIYQNKPFIGFGIATSPGLF